MKTKEELREAIQEILEEFVPNEKKTYSSIPDTLTRIRRVAEKALGLPESFPDTTN